MSIRILYFHSIYTSIVSAVCANLILKCESCVDRMHIAEVIPMLQTKKFSTVHSALYGASVFHSNYANYRQLCLYRLSFFWHLSTKSGLKRSKKFNKIQN
uniref:Uncharacterized protein n=1 Tax=Anopheles braziliensis TaxID=58242 RepID=A0A2M3ZL81_9DIPT